MLKHIKKCFFYTAPGGARVGFKIRFFCVCPPFRGGVGGNMGTIALVGVCAITEIGT